MHIDWCLCSCVYRVQACMVALYRNRARYNTNAPHTHTRALKMGANLLLRHDTCTGLGQRGDARILHINKPIPTHMPKPRHTTPHTHTHDVIIHEKWLQPGQNTRCRCTKSHRNSRQIFGLGLSIFILFLRVSPFFLGKYCFRSFYTTF